MSRSKILTLTLIMAVVITSCKTGDKKKDIAFTYPTTEKGTQVDVYYGDSIADPYRWLEDDRSAETGAWVKAQNEVTFGYLNSIPFREEIKKRLETLWNYERISAPEKKGDYTYFYKNDGLQNQAVLYRQKGDGEPEVFLDPNTFAEDGTISLGGVSFTKDGSKVAYSISEGGSDWRKIIIMNAVTKEIVEDTLVDVKFSGMAWRGNDGFYYSSYDKPDGSELSAKTDQHKLYYHKLGTDQKTDKVVFGNTIKRRYVGGYLTEDERFLVISAATSTSGNELYIKDLSNPRAGLMTIMDNFDTDTHVVDNKGDQLILITNYKAPNNRLVTTNLRNPKPETWKDFIPETEFVLSAKKGAGYIFANYMIDAVSKIKQYDYNGKLVRDIELPGVGSAGGFGGEKDDTELYYSFTNYVTPGSIYKFDPKTGKSEIYNTPAVDFNSDDYETKQVFYTSKDGTKVPMIITHKKGLKLDGNNPTILYGYGGFNISLTPYFSVANLVWMERGGVYAVPNLRGGGEYGKKWHDAGTQLHKQNVFDDFIAAAEYLIDNKYTSSDFLAIRGGSNGGLLVGATMTQRPDLMKVALPAVGVLDMLRYHTFTAGAGWAYDYGTSDQSEEMYQYLKGYSPVHNVKADTCYPATLVTTADHDDRVVPAHSFKFISELQDKQSCDNPVLIRIETNAGHGAGTPISKTIEQYSDIYAFTLWNMGVRE
ncbi:MAG: S9 family peptidase [Flavobacteriia bacterium]|nr:MAG: S9 family peptidase [Flavobacteriia bacterium]